MRRRGGRARYAGGAPSETGRCESGKRAKRDSRAVEIFGAEPVCGGLARRGGGGAFFLSCAIPPCVVRRRGPIRERARARGVGGVIEAKAALRAQRRIRDDALGAAELFGRNGDAPVRRARWC